MEYNKLIENLLNELSYRVGIVDLTNKTQQSVISEILTEWGEYEAKSIILDFLNEAGKTPEKNKPKSETEGEDSNYAHIGKGIYVKKGDKGKDGAQKYKKDDTGSLKPISDDEYAKEKGEQGEEGEAAAQNTQQNKTDNPPVAGGKAEPAKGTSLQDPTYQAIVDKETETLNKINGVDVKKSAQKEKEIQQNLSKEQKSARGLLKKLDTNQLKIDDPNLSDAEIEHIENFKNSLDEFLNNETSADRKAEIALELTDKFGLKTNTDIVDVDGNPKQVKLYVKSNYDGGKVPRSIEKILGENPNTPSSNLTNELNKYLDTDNQITANTIGGKNESALKVEFETAAKPSFKIEGGESKKEKIRNNPKANQKKKDKNNPGFDVDGNPLTITDPLVSQIFKPNSVLGDLKQHMHSLEGPSDGDGNLIPCDSSENKRKHFDFLINNNNSFDKVKQSAQKYIDDTNVSESDKEKFRKVINAIDSYKSEMNKIIGNIPSENSAKDVEKLNAKLMDDLHNSHPDIASGMAKQFAENALVTQEIAAGDEVYMPSQGTFPGGDKILVTRNGAVMEAVAGVSVKFGRAGKETQIYGFPGEAQSMANFAEPERLSDETEEQHQKRKQDIRTRNGKYVGQEGYTLGVRDDIVNDEDKFNEVLQQSDFGDTVTDSKKLHQLNKQIQTEVQKFMEEQRKLGRNEKSIRIGLQGHLKKWMNETDIQTQFENCIDRNKLTEKLTGSSDGTYTNQNGETKKHSNKNVAEKCNPLEFIGITSFFSSVREGKGMPSLLWNHQSYEDGEYHSETTNPADTDMKDPSNWGVSTRLFVTSGREGGGILATGTGEAKLKGNPLKNIETED